MGCVSSRDVNDQHPNIFQVMNVDDRMQPRGPGQIEITDTELVLHQKGKESTRWPLRSLRKYGFDSEIFSFECGRRCATGPGIYAFRLRKAEQLFNLLQHNILLRNSSEEANATATDGPSNGPPTLQRRPQNEGYLNPTSTSTTMQRPTLSRPGSITSNGPISPVSVSTPPLEHNNNKRASLEHSYLNTSLIEETVPYINLNTTTSTLPAVDCAPEEAISHLYMNVNTDTIARELEVDLPENEDPKHNYANINGMELDVPGTLLPSQQDSANHSEPPTPTSLYVTIREVNYVELDLDPGRSGGQTLAPPESPNKTKSYVTIDFNKTNALSQSINPCIELEDGSRKTRHNSTINDMNMRRCNSVSD